MIDQLLLEDHICFQLAALLPLDIHWRRRRGGEGGGRGEVEGEGEGEGDRGRWREKDGR